MCWELTALKIHEMFHFSNQDRKWSGFLPVWKGTHNYGKLVKEEQSIRQGNVQVAMRAEREYSVRNLNLYPSVSPGRTRLLKNGRQIHMKVRRNNSVGEEGVKSAFKTTYRWFMHQTVWVRIEVGAMGPPGRTMVTL